MPPVIIGVAAGVAASVAGATLLTAVAIGLASAGLYAVATMDIPSTPGTSPSNAKQTIRSPNQPFRAVVGVAMVGGPMIFAEEFSNKVDYEEEYEHCTYYHGGKVCEKKTRKKTKTTKFLHLVVPLACHPCEDVLEVYFGDEKQDDWDHDYWKINVVKGDQQSIADLPKLLTDVDSWTDTMIGKGITFVHVALRHSAEYFPNGLPNIKCLVQGMNVDTPMIKGYSNNAAAVIYHFLRYHFKAKEKEINTLSFQDAYSVSGELMPAETPPVDPDDPHAPLPATPIRYAIDGIYDFDESHENIMNKMLTACGGKLVYTNGQYHLHVAAYRGPVPQDQVISLSDLNGPINIVPETPLNDRINTIKGQHLDAGNFYQQVDFEPVTNPTYVAEDGEELTKDVDFEYVLNPQQAHRLAEIMLKDNRFGLTITVPMNLRGFKFNAGLPVRFDEKEFGYDKLEFQVTSWKLTDGKGIELVLKQTSPDIYDDSVVTVSPKPPSTNIPDPKFCFPVENLVFQPFADDGVYDGLLLWSHPDLDNVREFEVVVTSKEGQIFRYNPGKVQELYLNDMPKSDYNITVIAYNVYGSPSKPASIQADVGSTKPITSVVFEADNFEMNIIPKVSGILPSNTSFLFYRANDVDNPSPTNATLLGEGVTYVDVGLIPNTAYKYYVQVTNSTTYSELYGPYGAKTTDNPDDIYDFIKDEIPGQYTWVVYASDAFGADISKTYDPAVHHFEGRAYNKSTKEPSLNPLDYTFIRIGEFISPEDQDILDNLAQGKLPDGSADLVKPDDILFKPGDPAEGVMDNLEQGLLPDGSAPMVKPSDVLYKPGDPEQAVIANLSNGMMPDGSGPLVKPDDILFKPGDKVEETNIADNAISTPKLTANAITADKIAANAITAPKIAAGAVTATAIASQAITADKIAASAITADKIAVSVISPINNFSESGSLEGWSAPSTGSIVEFVPLDGTPARTLKVPADPSGEVNIFSSDFPVDHSAIYEVRVSYHSTQLSGGAETTNYMVAKNSKGDWQTCEVYDAKTLQKSGEFSQPVFWRGVVAQRWLHMVGYVVGASADISSVPSSINVDFVIKLKANVRTLSTRHKIAQSVSSNIIHYYSPSIVKVGSGILTANEVRAGAVNASAIAAGAVTAEKIAANAITADKIASNSIGTDELVANSVTTAKIAAGAVTATEIAANSITASKLLAGAVTAEKIAANAITADKIAVTVVSPVNNFSEFGDLRGWTVPSSASMAEFVDLNGSPARTLRVPSDSTKDLNVFSSDFSVDHNSVYEVRMSYFSSQSADGSETTNFMVAKDSSGAFVTCEVYHPVTLAKIGEYSEPVFWRGVVAQNWRHMVGYVVGASANVSAVPTSRNVSYIIKLKANVRTLSTRHRIKQSSGNIIHYYSPSVVKVGSGILTANEVRAGSKVTAPVIEGGTMSAASITGGTMSATAITGGSAKFGPAGGAPYGGYHTRISADGLIETDRIKATGGSIDNLTIGKNCDIQGTLTVKQLVGDVSAFSVVPREAQGYTSKNWTTVQEFSAKASAQQMKRFLTLNPVMFRISATSGEREGGNIAFEWKVVSNGTTLAYGDESLSVGAASNDQSYSFTTPTTAVFLGVLSGSIALQVRVRSAFNGACTMIKQTITAGLIIEGSEFI